MYDIITNDSYVNRIVIVRVQMGSVLWWGGADILGDELRVSFIK